MNTASKKHAAALKRAAAHESALRTELDAARAATNYSDAPLYIEENARRRWATANRNLRELQSAFRAA